MADGAVQDAWAGKPPNLVNDCCSASYESLVRGGVEPPPRTAKLDLRAALTFPVVPSVLQAITLKACSRELPTA